jgi:hypothetical protein
VRNKLSFVPDPGVLYVLPAPMSLLQTNLLAYRCSKISDFHS